MALVSIEDVSVLREGKALLNGVSFNIEPGEIVTLIGPNGAGKTTLVNVVLGLIKPNAGRVTFDRPMKFGYMPQKLAIDPTLPLSALRFLQLSNPDKTKCMLALEKTAVSKVAMTPIQSLSGGEMQRLLLAKAILSNPDLLVLDEPVQGVDVMGQESLYRLISQLRQELGCAVLMVSHDLHLVMGATDQVICLNQHICCHGTPEIVTVDPSFTELFGARTALYSHQHDHSHDMHGNVVDDSGCSHG